MARETWYVLEDGRAVDPAECSPDATGWLIHASGVKVAMRLADCPMSRGVDADAERAKAAAPADSAAAGQADAKDMKPEEPPAARPKPGYRTRDSKAG